MTRDFFQCGVLSCLAFLAIGVAVCDAQDLQNEGKFSITYTAVNPAPVKPVTVGKDREVAVSALIMTAVNDGGSGLLHNMSGRCVSIGVLDRAAKTLDVRGYCNYADRGGDQVFEEFSTPTPVALGSPVKYAGKWVGGTGKFTGLSGDFEISTSGNVAPEGLFQAAGKKVGSYRISK